MSAMRLAPLTLRIDEAEVAAYAAITGDFNPLHLDEAFARSTSHGTRIAHGTLSLNLLWQSVAATLGEEAVPGHTLDVRFVKPVRLGDTVTTGSDAAPGEDGALRVWVTNQHGEMVISGWLRCDA